MSLRVVPLTLAEANCLVARWHRHHKPVVGHRFSLGVEADGKLVGAAIVSRPVARMTDQYRIAEVTRLVTDGTRNACSILYAAAARVAKEMGFDRIQTFILATEPGTSLCAAGWTQEIESGGGQWDQTALKQYTLDAYAEGKALANRIDQPTEAKTRWAKVFRVPAEAR